MKDEITCLYYGDMLQYLAEHWILRNFTDVVGPWVCISFLSRPLASRTLVPLVPQSSRRNVGGVLDQGDAWQQAEWCSSPWTTRAAPW